MVICLERGADLHMAQLMPLPLTVSCFSKIQIGFTFLVPAHLGSPGKRAVKRARDVLSVILDSLELMSACRASCDLSLPVLEVVISVGLGALRQLNQGSFLFCCILGCLLF